MSAGCSRGTLLLPPPPDALASAPSDRAASRTAYPDNTLSPLDAPPRHQPRPYDAAPTFVHTNPVATGAIYTTRDKYESRSFRSQHYQAVWDSLDPGTSDVRPNHPYTELIKLCILKRREGKLTLNELYRDLEAKFAFFATCANGKGWKNTLRHNLSTQPYFVKLEREHGQLGKGHYWAYDPKFEKPSSLAQSSVVQLSALWPTCVSASAGLPRFEEYGHVLPHAHARADTHPYAPIAMLRRRSSPARQSRALQQERPAGVRNRSATFSTFSAPAAANEWDAHAAAGIEPTSAASTATDGDRDSSSSSSSSRGSSRAGDGGDEVTRLPRLPDLPPVRTSSKGKSLGDWYLAHPIARR
ncbi:related to HCM1-Forkhead transcription factor [Sporisorium reilianum f. sp. reilianum]|uniref:Related to HCM1-Forkhead transcription factor n=1 Tax=Sporisorium reilianum f. sp. reilianum TaxID=72559 RepID=A0A2N8U971_9BASI|nr:related to HCM1-Forkhead transcription factor [Sporisorium reilianum f. sp. reilianum]